MTELQGSVGATLGEIRARLDGVGFTITESVPFKNCVFRMVATKSRIEATKFGKMATFWVFTEIPNLTVESLRSFSADAFSYALEAKSTLPRGFGGSLLCFSAVVTDGVDQHTAACVENQPPPRHFGAFELPVVIDLSARRVFKFEKTPFWGSAYFKGFRTQVETYIESASSVRPSMDVLPPQSQTAVGNERSGGDLADQIQRLQDLRNQGALTEDEFVLAKCRLLGDGGTPNVASLASSAVVPNRTAPPPAPTPRRNDPFGRR